MERIAHHVGQEHLGGPDEQQVGEGWRTGRSPTARRGPVHSAGPPAPQPTGLRQRRPLTTEKPAMRRHPPGTEGRKGKGGGVKGKRAPGCEHGHGHAAERRAGQLDGDGADELLDGVGLGEFGLGDQLGHQEHQRRGRQRRWPCRSPPRPGRAATGGVAQGHYRGQRTHGDGRGPDRPTTGTVRLEARSETAPPHQQQHDLGQGRGHADIGQRRRGGRTANRPARPRRPGKRRPLAAKRPCPSTAGGSPAAAAGPSASTSAAAVTG